MQAIQIGSSDRADTDLKVLWVGIGYEKNTSQQLIEIAVQSICRAHNLAAGTIAGLATLDSKACDSKLMDLCHDRQWQLRGFPASDLRSVTVPNPSAIVVLSAGTPSVAEAAAILAASHGAGENLSVLSVPKQIFRQDGLPGAVTVAIARSVARSKEFY